MKKRLLISAVVVMLASMALQGSTTSFYKDASLKDFEKGKLENISINDRGELYPSPKSSLILEGEELFVWDLVQTDDGSLYAATGIKGKLFRIQGTNVSLVRDSKALSIRALAAAPGNTVYAASTPNGKLYTFKPGQEASLLTEFEETYIWDMDYAGQDTLYVTTGNPARLYSVNTENGSKKMLYEAPGESHLLCVAANEAGSVYFGSEGKGILYKRNRDGKVSVMFDTFEDEISTLYVDKKGTVYFATANQRRKGFPGNFDYSDSLDFDEREEQQASSNDQEKKKKKKKAPLKNSIYRIGSDEKVEKIFTMKNVSFFSLAADSRGNLYAGSGDYGVLYMIRPDNQASRVLRLPQSQLLSLLPVDDGLVIGTGNNGRVYKLAYKTELSGTYTSRVFDGQTRVRWGSLQWEARSASGASIDFYVRSGNTARPDKEWSEWKGPLRSSGSAIPFVDTRYIQYRIKMTASGIGNTPSVQSVKIPFRRANRAPRIKKIILLTYKDAKEKKKLNLDRGQIAITWLAEDDDKDQLEYSLFFRFEGQHQWFLLKDQIRKNSISFHTSLLPDGKYRFRILATDINSNTEKTAETATRESRTFIIDNTPPEARKLKAYSKGDSIIISGTVRDALSNVASIRYSLNTRGWRNIDPADLVYDEQEESIHIVLDRRKNPHLRDGRNVLLVRMLDDKDNSQTAKVFFDIKLKKTDRAKNVPGHQYLDRE